MDTYMEVKGSIGKDAKTLWSQAIEIYVRWRAARDPAIPYVSLGTVLRILDPSDLDKEDLENPDEILTKKQLCERIPDLAEEQAESILKEVRDLVEQEGEEGATISTAMQRIQGMDLKVRHIYDG